MIYMEKYARLHDNIVQLQELLQEYQQLQLKPYISFYGGSDHHLASTTLKEMRKYEAVDSTRRPAMNFFEDIESYRLVMGYGHLFNVTYVDPVIKAISKTELKAVFMKHVDGEYLIVFQKPAVADENKLLCENDKIRLTFENAEIHGRIPSDAGDIDDISITSDDSDLSKLQDFWPGRILPQPEDIPPYLVSSCTCIASHSD